MYKIKAIIPVIATVLMFTSCKKENAINDERNSTEMADNHRTPCETCESYVIEFDIENEEEFSSSFYEIMTDLGEGLGESFDFIDLDVNVEEQILTITPGLNGGGDDPDPSPRRVLCQSGSYGDFLDCFYNHTGQLYMDGPLGPPCMYQIRTWSSGGMHYAADNC